MDYTVHLGNGPLCTKNGCSLVFRRSVKKYTLLAWLVHKNNIYKCTSEVLSELLTMHHVRMAKTATKITKVRKLLTLAEVTTQCTQQEINDVENLLKHLEEKRKKGKKQDNNEDEQEEDEASI